MANAADQVTVVTENEPNTDALGVRLANVLRPGTLIALSGTLGAGKTRLVQSIAKAFGVDSADVGSPTFSLSRIYRAGDTVLNHIDLFRINDEDEYFELGIDECLEQNQIVFVEWAEKFVECLPPERVNINIEVDGPQQRTFNISLSGPQDKSILIALSE